MKSKNRKCFGCKNSFSVEKLYFAENGMKAYCSAECGTILALHLSAKRNAARLRQTKKENATHKKDFYRTDTGWQHNATKAVFNRVRKLQEYLWFAVRNLEPHCISCGKTNMDWACGHYKTVGAQGNLRYDELNTYLQCNRYCNKGLSGNIAGNKNTIGYTKGIIERFGRLSGEAIIYYCETNTKIRNWTWQEIEEIRMNYLAKEKVLKVELAKYE